MSHVSGMVQQIAVKDRDVDADGHMKRNRLRNAERDCEWDAVWERDKDNGGDREEVEMVISHWMKKKVKKQIEVKIEIEIEIEMETDTDSNGNGGSGGHEHRDEYVPKTTCTTHNTPTPTELISVTRAPWGHE